MNRQAEQALALAGFPGPLVDAVGNALAYIDHLRGIRDEQAAKLRRHLDEIAELQERAGIAEGRETAAKANAEQMAGWLGARNAGLVQMARERDALREKLAAVEAERDALKNRFTRPNPATGNAEPWDPTETLREIRKYVPDDRRLDGFTLSGAVSEMARLLAVAEAKAARMVARVCAGCHGCGVAHLDGGSHRCAACGGAGAVIVETGSGG